MLTIDWSQLKAAANSRSLSIQWVDLEDRYWLGVFDGPFQLQSFIHKTADSDSASLSDFETNFKAGGNKGLPSMRLPFASKILPNGKKLYKREHGIQQTLSSGANTILFTIPYAWVKIIGVEILFGEKLDTCDFFILDSTAGAYTTVPNYVLNQFGFGVNIAANQYEEENAYDADLYYGMQLKIVYNSQSAKTVGINFNLTEVKS